MYQSKPHVIICIIERFIWGFFAEILDVERTVADVADSSARTVMILSAARLISVLWSFGLLENVEVTGGIDRVRVGNLIDEVEKLLRTA